MWKKKEREMGEEPKKGKLPKRAKIAVAGVAAAAAVGILLSDSFYQIQEQEQAVLVTLGVPSAVTETGLHFKIPFIQRVSKVNTTI